MKEDVASPFRLNEEGNVLFLLDQTLLPHEVKYIPMTDPREVFEGIRELKVRGAPAIGIAASYGLYLAMLRSSADTLAEYYSEFSLVKEYLASSRPTAVNLFWAMEWMDRTLVREMKAAEEKGLPDREIIPTLTERLRKEADAIREEDVEVCRRIGERGLSLLRDGMGILTHCNAGTIATAKYGTALAPIYLGKSRGYHFTVYADESRPLLQGARLTTWELKHAGIDVVLICDDMASTVMRKGWVQAVIVGCDRVASNGDTANKIGTSSLAILSEYYNVPFYVACPLSTVDLNCLTGGDIVIEERPGEEITEKWYARRMAPEGIRVYNPAFDVTDNDLITAIITEKGVIYPPYEENLPAVLEKE